MYMMELLAEGETSYTARWKVAPRTALVRVRTPTCTILSSNFLRPSLSGTSGSAKSALQKRRPPKNAWFCIAVDTEKFAQLESTTIVGTAKKRAATLRRPLSVFACGNLSNSP